MIQFHVSRLFGLRVEADGVLIPGEAGLQLVFHQPDGDEQLLEADVKSVQIPWKQLESWDVDYGLLCHRVLLKVTAVDDLLGVPGADDRQVELTVHRRHREALQDFEQRTLEYQLGKRVDRIDEMIDDIRDFLDDN